MPNFPLNAVAHLLVLCSGLTWHVFMNFFLWEKMMTCIACVLIIRGPFIYWYMKTWSFFLCFNLQGHPRLWEGQEADFPFHPQTVNVLIMEVKYKLNLTFYFRFSLKTQTWQCHMQFTYYRGPPVQSSYCIKVVKLIETDPSSSSSNDSFTVCRFGRAF